MSALGILEVHLIEHGSVKDNGKLVLQPEMLSVKDFAGESGDWQTVALWLSLEQFLR